MALSLPPQPSRTQITGGVITDPAVASTQVPHLGALQCEIVNNELQQHVAAHVSQCSHHQGVFLFCFFPSNMWAANIRSHLWRGSQEGRVLGHVHLLAQLMINSHLFLSQENLLESKLVVAVRRIREGIVREFGMDLCTLLYLKWITKKDLLDSTGNSAECYVAAWMGGESGGEWIQVYVRLSPFAVLLKLSQHY